MSTLVTKLFQRREPLWKNRLRFRRARRLIYWNAFNARLARAKESATTITRETWVLPLLEELGFTLAFQRAAAAASGGTFTCHISHEGLVPLVDRPGAEIGE